MPAKVKNKKTNTVPPSKEEGVIWLASAGGTVYSINALVSADTLTKYKKNVYGKGLSRKQSGIIFSKKYVIHVKDEKQQETDKTKEVADAITKMCDAEEVKLWNKIKMAWNDIFWFGAAFFNPVWEKQGSVRVLTKFRHLPPYSFDTAPPKGVWHVYSDILRGVILNEKTGKIEFWQRQSENQTDIKQLENVYYLKEPDTDELIGEPIVYPLIPIFAMLEYCHNTNMQRVNRSGAPIMFLKITNPQGPNENNGMIGDVEYGNLLLLNWGKDTAFQLRQGMELIIPNFPDTSATDEVIDVLARLVVDYLSPASFISTRTGTLIGGSYAPQEQMMLQYIQGVHEWVQPAFEKILQEYLDSNQYPGYTVSIELPLPTIDKSQLRLAQAQAMMHYGYGFINEARDYTDLKPLDEEGIGKLLEEQTMIKQANPTPAPFGLKMSATPEGSLIIEKKKASTTEAKMADELQDVVSTLEENIARVFK
jgi:hypothetical protein